MALTEDRSRSLALFATIAEQGSFSAAGRALGLTPSAVSRAVARTEERLGVRLVLRSTRLLSLTAEGEIYVAAAKRILRDLDDAEQSIADSGIPRGRLKVSAAWAHGRLCIVPLLGEFTRAYPGILVDLSLSDEIVEVGSGETDVAIRFGPLPDSTLTARKLGESRRVVVASPAYLAQHGTPAKPEDLLRHNCLNFNFRRTEPIWPFRERGREFTLNVAGSIEANAGDTLVELALGAVGITRVADFSVAQEVASGRLVTLLEEFNPGDAEVVHALFVGGATMPARVRVFVDYLATKLASRMIEVAPRELPT